LIKGKRFKLRRIMKRLPPIVYICVAISLSIPALVTAQNIGKVRGKGAKPGEVITAPDRSERWPDRIKVGEVAPEFKLPLLAKDQAKEQSVALTELRAKRPVVLIFGSITCPPFRGQLESVDKVYDQFAKRAEFLFVYIREAHPDSVLSVMEEGGGQSLQKIEQAGDAATRIATAATCQRSSKLRMPVAVDTIDNVVGKAYAGWPNRMVVVGTDGRVLLASEPSPRGTDAERLEKWLKEHLPKAE
jgi:hypothetical protein